VGLVVGVVAQIVLGGLTVLFDLKPPFVMGHFLLSMALLWDAVVLHHRAGEPDESPRPVVGRRVVLLGRAMAVLSAIVVVLGTVVTASGPHGGDESAERFDFSLSSVTRIHASFAIALLLLTIWFLVVLAREEVGERIELPTRLFLLLLLAQGAVGYVQYFNELPVLLVGIHVTGAVAIWATVLVINLRMFERAAVTERAPSRASEQGVARVQSRQPV
jgi:cytochrome c oxidase assembly protein subunit 15